MTYRELRRGLVVGSAVVLVCVWVWSCWKVPGLNLNTPRFGLAGDIQYGTVRLTSWEAPSPFSGGIPVSDLRLHGDVIGYGADSDDRWYGRWTANYVARDGSHFGYLWVPVWVPWLAFVGCVAAVTRFMEKRSQR